ncbi:MAG: hydrogenase small subunit [Deltaproteobacteria bacterium]|nr:MAG: hydrogenase small subunit [Deltaproteobacteria bacterium]
MALTRRELLEGGLGTISVLSFSLVRIPGLDGRARADAGEPVAEIPVIWMATGACSGCSVALLNTASPTIQEVLLDPVLPGLHLSLGFHSTVMAASGELAMQALETIAREHRGAYVLVVDGVTAAADDGLYCRIGERDGRPVTAYERVVELGGDALAVLAVGACAAFGGIPAAAPNPTQGLSIGELFQREGIAVPYVNIPGCPPHPDWIVGTIATLLLAGVDGLALDEHHRPAPFFAERIHDRCQYRGNFERGEFAERFGEHGCLLKLGCKGPITRADCPVRKFNNGTSWCCEAGHPCIGCCHPDFPFESSMFEPVEPSDLTFPAAYAPAEEPAAGGVDTGTYVTLGLIGASAFLAGVGVATAANRLNAEEREEEAEPPASPGREE